MKDMIGMFNWLRWKTKSKRMIRDLTHGNVLWAAQFYEEMGDKRALKEVTKEFARRMEKKEK